MSVSFYTVCEQFPGDLKQYVNLEVSVFNAETIFEMLNINGETEQGTVGSIDREECVKALESLQKFIIDNREIYNPLGMDRLQYQKYTNSLFYLLGYCIGRDCKFCWA